MKKTQTQLVKWFAEEMCANLSTFTLTGRDRSKALYKVDGSDRAVFVEAGENDFVKSCVENSKYKSHGDDVLYMGLDTEPVPVPGLAETLRELHAVVFSGALLRTRTLLFDGTSVMLVGSAFVYRGSLALPEVERLGNGHWFGVDSALAEVFLQYARYGLDAGLIPELRTGIPDGETFQIELRMTGLNGFTVTLRVPVEDMFGEWVDTAPVYTAMLHPATTIAKVRANSLKHALVRCRTSRKDKQEIQQEHQLAEILIAADGVSVVPVHVNARGMRVAFPEHFNVQAISVDGGYDRSYLARESILEAFTANAGARAVMLAASPVHKVLHVSTRPEAVLTMICGNEW